MSLKATNENLPPTVIRQLAKELKNLDDSPLEGIKVIVNDEDFTTIFADIEGPGKILFLSDTLLCTFRAL
jgi:ubiquitin-conjugating enzyme E2 S